MKAVVRSAALAVAIVLSACAGTAAPTATAAKVEQLECTSATLLPDDARLLRETRVLKVEPTYLHDTCAGTAEVTGAKLVVRPRSGVSAGQLARMLQCASARATLGRADPSRLPNDPYGFPGAWVDVDVTPDGDNFVVTLSANSVPNNIRLLRRATAFLAAQRS